MIGKIINAFEMLFIMYLKKYILCNISKQCYYTSHVGLYQFICLFCRHSRSITIWKWLSTELIESRISCVDRHWQYYHLHRYCYAESRNPRSIAILHSTGVPVYLVPLISCPRGKDTAWYLVPGDTLPRGRMSLPGLSCPVGTVSCPRGHFTPG